MSLAAQGRDNDEIAAALGTSTVTTGLWRQRFIDLGLAGLAEAPRPGRPVTLDGTWIIGNLILEIKAMRMDGH